MLLVTETAMPKKVKGGAHAVRIPTLSATCSGNTVAVKMQRCNPLHGPYVNATYAKVVGAQVYGSLAASTSAAAARQICLWQAVQSCKRWCDTTQDADTQRG